MKAAVVTTFPNGMWNVYAKSMVESFVRHWPREIPLLVQLDDDLLYPDVERVLREQDAVAVGWEPAHKAFVERNKDRDDPGNYRKQAVRFCHKVFAIHRAYVAARKAPENERPRYLIWLDADVITNRTVTLEEVSQCLPKAGDAVSYLGRKDWPHSECGWLAFDLENGGDEVICRMVDEYETDQLFNEKEWHDSWIWDRVREQLEHKKWSNLTEGKPGMDIWPHSPMGAWSTHHKGPVAKEAMNPQAFSRPVNGSNVVIQTKNSIPDEDIRKHVEENQLLIKNWVMPCTPADEEIVVVSAGPMMIAEDVLPDYRAGKKIVAVKHALDRLKAADIKPWACILLDPRPHVYDFVKEPDPDVIWFVASQVNPKVTMRLLAAGCTVWGYHAAVGAGEHELTAKQQYAVISGGSATATRGIFLLRHLGFSNFKLVGYDLCFPDKPDLKARDDKGQPKYLEMSIGYNHPQWSIKRMFYTEPQLLAQFQEFNELVTNESMKFTAVGDGMVPFVLKARAICDLRDAKQRGKIPEKVSYEELLCNRKKKTSFLTKLLRK